jgi:hypothetical protein
MNLVYRYDKVICMVLQNVISLMKNTVKRLILDTPLSLHEKMLREAYLTNETIVGTPTVQQALSNRRSNT